MREQANERVNSTKRDTPFRIIAEACLLPVLLLISSSAAPIHGNTLLWRLVVLVISLSPIIAGIRNLMIDRFAHVRWAVWLSLLIMLPVPAWLVALIVIDWR
ncbi:MAG TPA: hypothetical protein VI454_00450 [Verrucomicrobiae bacterium]|jgi:hypothetical protein